MMYNLIGIILLLGIAIQVDAASNECWGKWINENKPNDTNNRTDVENKPSDIGCNGTNTRQAAQCQDENLEAFTGNKNDSTSHYIATCDFKNGLKCTPYPNFKSYNYTCPDFSIQFGCECPTSGNTGNTQSTANGVNSQNGGNIQTGGGSNSGGATSGHATSRPNTTWTGANPGNTNPSTGGNNGGNSGQRFSLGLIQFIFILAVFNIL